MTGNPKIEFKHQVEGLCALWRWDMDSLGSGADGVGFIGPTRIWTAHEKNLNPKIPACILGSTDFRTSASVGIGYLRLVGFSV